MKKQRKIYPRKVKAALCLEGMSLRRWSIENGYPVSTVSMVMHGKRTTGPVAKEIITKLCEVA
jgi:lambda repressor-like predicted transcriptional regulator